MVATGSTASLVSLFPALLSLHRMKAISRERARERAIEAASHVGHSEAESWAKLVRAVGCVIQDRYGTH